MCKIYKIALLVAEHKIQKGISKTSTVKQIVLVTAVHKGCRYFHNVCKPSSEAAHRLTIHDMVLSSISKLGMFFFSFSSLWQHYSAALSCATNMLCAKRQRKRSILIIGSTTNVNSSIKLYILVKVFILNKYKII